MQYKINTKENFDIIVPQMAQFVSIMAEELISHCAELQKNDKSAIIDFSNVLSIDGEMLVVLEKLHAGFYDCNLSCAFCNLNPDIKPLFSRELNIVPTQIEAIDLVSMEGLERELLGDF
jgi:anti-anti-sigma regulatory factor